jgi:hypothetical protein
MEESNIKMEESNKKMEESIKEMKDSNIMMMEEMKELKVLLSKK